MSQKERSNRDYLLWTLLTMFAIIAVVGIYRSHLSDERADAAKAEVLALEGRMAQPADPNLAFQKAAASLRLDSTNAKAQQLLFDLYVGASAHPFYEEITRFPAVSIGSCSPDGRFWGVAEGKSLRLYDMESGKEERTTLPEAVIALALSETGGTWAAVDAGQHLHLSLGGLRHSFDLSDSPGNYSLHFSPKLGFLACLSQNSAEILDLHAMEWVQMSRTPLAVQGDREASRWLRFSEDEKYLAFCLAEKDAYVVGLPGGNTMVAGLEGDADCFPNDAIFLKAGEEGGPASVAIQFCEGGGKSMIARLDEGGQGGLGLEEMPNGGPAGVLYQSVRPGAKVKLGPQGPWEEVSEVIARGPELTLARLGNGAVAQVVNGSLESKALFNCAAGIAGQVARPEDGGLAAVCGDGTLRRWREPAKLFVEHLPEKYELVFTTPYFEAGRLRFIDADGSMSTYDLLEGRVEFEADSLRRQVALVASAETKARMANWLGSDAPALDSLAGFHQMEAHWEGLFDQVDWEYEGIAGEYRYLLAPDKQSLVVAIQEETSGRFYNQFVWVPVNAQAVLRLLEGGVSGNLEPIGAPTDSLASD